MNKSRRRLIKSAAGLVTALATHSLGATSLLTPRQTAGPFYPARLPLDDDSDLTRVSGQEQPARGEICDLHGRLLDRNGHPLAGVRIEIWQCDANGRYRHPRDPGREPIDPGFQGFGHTLSDTNGHYRFRTIRPVPYPGRTPHIHVAVRPPGQEPFVTQFYIADEPRNADDFLFQRIPVEQRPLVLVDFKPATEAGSSLQANRDIILGIG
jgi:protocatechuate 3,4-dioxygenase beta subunit